MLSSTPFDDTFEALTAGQSVTTRLGVFYVLPIPAYEGRNPRTGEVVVVAARRSYLFLASDELASAAFAASREEPFAERQAALVRDEPNVLAPRIEVAVSQAELERIAADLAAARQSHADVALGRLGVLRARPFTDGRRFAIQFTPSSALDETKTPN